MWSLITGLLQSLFIFGANLLDTINREKDREAGRNQAENQMLIREVHDAAIAAQVDSRPTPDDKSTILSGM